MARKSVVVRRVSPFSLFRTALALSLAGLVAWLVAVCILYIGMDLVGVWDKLNTIIGGAGGTEVVTFGLVISAAAFVGALCAITVTVLSPIAAIIYNSTVDLFGGVEVTLREAAD